MVRLSPLDNRQAVADRRVTGEPSGVVSLTSQNEGDRDLKGCDLCSRFPCVHPDAGRSVTGMPDARGNAAFAPPTASPSKSASRLTYG